MMMSGVMMVSASVCMWGWGGGGGVELCGTVVWIGAVPNLPRSANGIADSTL